MDNNSFEREDIIPRLNATNINANTTENTVGSNSSNKNHRMTQELYRPPCSRSHHSNHRSKFDQNHNLNHNNQHNQKWAPSNYKTKNNYHHQQLNRNHQTQDFILNQSCFSSRNHYGPRRPNYYINYNYDSNKITQKQQPRYYHSNYIETKNKSMDSIKTIDKQDQYLKNLNQFNQLSRYSDKTITSIIEKFDLITCLKLGQNQEKNQTLSLNNLVSILSTQSQNSFHLKKTLLHEDLPLKKAHGIIILPKLESSTPDQLSGLKNQNFAAKKTITNMMTGSTSTCSNTSSHKYGGIIRLNRDTMQLLQKNSFPLDDNKSTSSIISMPQHHPLSTSLECKTDFKDFEELLNRIRYILASRNHHQHRIPSNQYQIRAHSDPLVKGLRQKIMSTCKHLLLTDLNRSTLQNVLPNTWDWCFYEFIKLYRNNDFPSRSQIQQEKRHVSTEIMSPLNVNMSTLTQEGLDYFGSLFHHLLTRYNFPMKILYDRHKYYKINPSLYSHLHDITYIVKIIFIYLGDLWRYIELGGGSQTQTQQSHFANSKNYYMKAHMLVPKNSHICSQLSLVSFYQKNYFEAIYFSIVSLEYEVVHDRSSNRFISKCLRVFSNRQNLLVFFDYVRTSHRKLLEIIQREYNETMEKQKLKQKRLKRGHSRINKYYRIEYWVRPNKSIAKCDMYNFYDLAAVNSNETDPDLLQFYQEVMLKKLMTSFKDLKDRFTLSFLMVHGMLNYRTGLDRFFDVANQMILEFDLLLNYNSNQSNNSPLNCNNRNSTKAQHHQNFPSFFMIQLFVINIYSVANTFNFNEYKNSNGYQNAACYGFTHSNAYFIMSIMISIVLKRLIRLFDTFRRKHQDFLQQTLEHPKFKKVLLDKEPESVEDFFGSVYQTLTSHESRYLPTTNEKFENQQTTTDPQVISIQEWFEFYTLLPCVKLWCDWIISFNPYFPPQEMNDIKTNIETNVWQIFAEFLTLLHQIKEYPVNFYSDEKSKVYLSLSSPKRDTEAKEEYELVHLPEDRCLDGFKLLQDTPESSKYVKHPFIPEIAYIYMRVESIKLFGDYLCGLKYPYLKFDSKNSSFESQIQMDDIENQPGVKLKQIQERQLIEAMNRYKEYYPSELDFNVPQSEIETDKQLKEDEECYSDDEEAIQEMKSLNLCPSERRKLLQYRMFRKQNVQHGKYFKMIEHIKEPKRRFIICPKYVIFDTNCFINDLMSISHFVKTAPFTVTVPLIVIRELQSMMTRGQRINMSNSNNDSPIIEPQTSDTSLELDPSKLNRFKQLSMKATEILDFLNKAFEDKSTNIRAVTSKGSLLDRIDYKEEFLNPDAFNNDDMVLYACVNLVSKYNKDTPTDESMRRLLEDSGEHVTNQDEYVYRDVILITDDMNLRIKSLGYDVPVKKLKQFLKWTCTLDTSKKLKG